VTQFAHIVKTETNAPRRKEALIYLIHFLGDIPSSRCTARPASCRAASSDRGGNLITGITLTASTSTTKDEQERHLHFLWDVSLTENVECPTRTT